MERRTGIPQGSHAEWEKKQKLQLRLVRWSITLLCAAVAVVGLLLLILPGLKIKEIEVTGNSITPSADIIAAAGIQVGDEIFRLTQGQIADNIQLRYPSLGVSVSCGLSKVTITITERGSSYIAYAGHWFLLDRDLQVVTVSDNEADFADYPKMVMPAVAQLSVGKKVQFAEDGIDRAYIGELVALLEREGLLSHVTYIDVSEKFHISYVLEGQIRVVLGKLSDVELKMEMTEEILSARFENEAPYVIVDVSDLKRTTYRAMQTPDELLTY